MWSSTAKSFLKSLSLTLPERLCLSPQDRSLRQKKKSESPFVRWPVRFTHRGENWEEFKKQSSSRESQSFSGSKGKCLRRVNQICKAWLLKTNPFSLEVLQLQMSGGSPAAGWQEASTCTNMGYSVDITRMPVRKWTAWNGRHLPIQLYYREVLPVLTSPDNLIR